MELSWFNILAAAWLSTWVLRLIRLYLPAMRIMTIHYPTHTAVKYRCFGFGIFGGLALVAVPILLPVILDDILRERFIKSYIEGVTGLKKEDE